MHICVYTYIRLLVEGGNSIARLPRPSMCPAGDSFSLVCARSDGCPLTCIRPSAKLLASVHAQAQGERPPERVTPPRHATPCRTTPRSLLIFPRLCERATEEGPPARSALCHVIWKVDYAS